MCGIVGYIGNRAATEFLLEGLRRLEYRGYDSAGVATLDRNADFHITKAVGRIQNLSDRLEESAAEGNVGIGHTRWATHGPPTEENAHPHAGGNDDIAIVHNGVIENYASLRHMLQDEGFTFRSATDSEVVAHLIVSSLRKQGISSFDEANDGDLVNAVKLALAQLRGTYGLVVLFKSHPNIMLAARLGSPLVVGVGKNEHFVASDASPLVGYTDRIVYLADHQIAVITADELNVAHRDQGQIKHDIQVLNIESNMVSLDDEYEHYMLKEIFEQPNSLRDAMRGRLSVDDATAMFGGLNLSPPTTATSKASGPHRMRYQLARSVGWRIPTGRIRSVARGSGVCERTAISQSTGRY